jgi:hypothetical protein
MALIFLDGFDKFGPANSNTTNVIALMAGEWTTFTGTATIVAPLSATGQAISFTVASSFVKTLASSVGRIIGGIRFSSNLGALAGVNFQDATTAQCGIGINTTGTISIRNGAYATGTVIATSTASVSANSTHYLEWDIALGNSAAYVVYLDGVSIISGTGDTTTTGNNTMTCIFSTRPARPTTRRC